MPNWVFLHIYCSVLVTHCGSYGASIVSTVTELWRQEERIMGPAGMDQIWFGYEMVLIWTIIMPGQKATYN